MKKQIRSIVSVIGLFSLCFTACSVEHKEVPLTLWYNTPADATATDNPNKGYDDDAEWLKALPLGNGSLGAMVFGDVHKERIQLNEETMWSGSIQDSDNPEAAKHIEEIKQLLFDGKYKEATDLTNRTQICTGKGSGHGQGSNAPFGCYQTMGDLWIDFDNKSPYTDYRRELNLDDATARISYKQGDVNFKREIFISHPDQSMVMRISADKKQQLSFTCRMNRPERYSTYFMKIDGVKFRQKVVPGDTLLFRVELLAPIRRGISTMKGYAFVGEKVVCEAEFMAQIVKNK